MDDEWQMPRLLVVAYSIRSQYLKGGGQDVTALLKCVEKHARADTRCVRLHILGCGQDCCETLCFDRISRIQQDANLIL